jgi:hypothetical protein
MQKKQSLFSRKIMRVDVGNSRTQREQVYYFAVIGLLVECIFLQLRHVELVD